MYLERVWVERETRLEPAQEPGINASSYLHSVLIGSPI